MSSSKGTPIFAKIIIGFIAVTVIINIIGAFIGNSLTLGSGISIVASVFPILIWVFIIGAVIYSAKNNPKYKFILKNQNDKNNSENREYEEDVHADDEEIVIPDDFHEAHNQPVTNSFLFTSRTEDDVLYYENGKPIYKK